MMTVTVAELCAAARADVVSLGELGRELAAALDVVAATAGERPVAVLADPAFALEVMAAPWLAGRRPATAAVGRVLDHLRAKARLTGMVARFLTVRDAAADWETRGLALSSPATAATYRTWIRRLVAAHGDDDIAAVTAVHLAQLIASYTRGSGRARGSQSGRSAEETAISAYRHFWSHLVAAAITSTNPARQLRKPIRHPTHRRPIRTDEAALVRQFARLSNDPLLDEVAVCLAERLGVRPVELAGLQLGDVDLDHAEITVVGKGGKRRWLPLPPHLAALIARYVHDRRAGLSSAAEWSSSTGPFFRRAASPTTPAGTPLGRVWMDDLFPRLARALPSTRTPVSLYSYRHAIATWVDPRYGRAMTRRILGHTSKTTPTEAYVHVDDDQLRAAVAAYEAHLLEELSA